MKLEIFFEKDSTYGARLDIDKQHIFATGKTYDDLFDDIKKGLACVFKKDEKASRSLIQVAKFLRIDTFQHVAKI